MPTFEQIQDEIASMLSLSDEELTPEQRHAMDAYLDELGTQEASKVDGFAAFLREQSARADAYRKESQRLAGKARSVESNLGWLKGKYLTVMQQRGLRKINGAAYTISLRTSEVVMVEDMDKLPAAFVERKETFAPSKTAIRDAIKAGQDVPGARLQTVEHLQVR